MGATTLVPQILQVPDGAKSKNKNVMMVIQPEQPASTKPEVKFKFSQAVAFKLKHKDKITKNFLKDQQVRNKIMEMQPE